VERVIEAGVTFKAQSENVERNYAVLYPSVIEKFGGLLHKLVFSNKHGLIPWDEDIQYNMDMRSGFFVDLFMHCTSLKKLELWHFEITRLDPNEATDSSITHLKMDWCILSHNILSQVSIRLPSLQNLRIQNCNYFQTDHRRMFERGSKPVCAVNIT
jgi:hypothetical protein